MSRLEDGWDASVSAWANARDDVRALVQFGSRVRNDGTADRWSDYDYHIITSNPRKYGDGSFASELGACWASATRVSFGNVVRVTAIYEGALEADFIVLSHVEMVVVALALRWPSTARFWPRALAGGVSSLKIAAAPGWKVIKGGSLWEKRYARITPPHGSMTEAEFGRACGEFWVELVWAAKKVARGEYRAAQRAVHEHLIENGLRVFREEALMHGRAAYPVGRRAESWLTPDQLAATLDGTRPDRAALMSALSQISGEFAASSIRVASQRNWRIRDFSEVRAWLAGLRGS
jgi:hypothetical protein